MTMSLVSQEVVEDLNGDPEENSSHYMSILIEALSILGKVEETLDVCTYTIYHGNACLLDVHIHTI